jgi:hypothetical protein
MPFIGITERYCAHHFTVHAQAQFSPDDLRIRRQCSLGNCCYTARMGGKQKIADVTSAIDFNECVLSTGLRYRNRRLRGLTDIHPVAASVATAAQLLADDVCERPLLAESTRNLRPASSMPAVLEFPTRRPSPRGRVNCWIFRIWSYCASSAVHGFQRSGA